MSGHKIFTLIFSFVQKLLYSDIPPESLMTYTQICPRCERPNQCGFSKDPEKTSCWCSELKVPDDLRVQIQEEWGSASCLCKTCLAELVEEHLKSTE